MVLIDHLMEEEEAAQIAAQVSDGYLSCVDVGGAHFELLNVTLKWNAFCGGVVEGDVVLSGGRFTGLPLIGALRWFDRMRYYHQFGAPYSPHREDIHIDHVEAAACMALWEQGNEEPDRPLEALLERVNDILGEAALGAIDEQRLREAMDRLKTLGCLTPRAGWYGLREEMGYQVPEE